MKKTRRTTEKPAARTRPEFRMTPARYALAFGAAALATLLAYAPALRGEFVLDDLSLSFTGQEYFNAPLRTWLIGVRPLLSLSFFANFQLFGGQPFSFHLVNVLLHTLTGGLVFLIVRKLLPLAGESGLRRDALSGFAAGIFLLHPIQTESVAYVASRSEVLSVLFCYAALAVFLLRRREAISWTTAVAVALLFGVAVNTKEHTAVLPAILLLTDYYWNPGFSLRGALRNWRLYVLIAAGGALAARMVYRVLWASNTAGFRIKDMPWDVYFYTQGRVIWSYIRLFFLPFGQNLDPDVALSRSPLDGGAVFAWLALAAVTGVAIWRRRRYPLASYGWLVFLALLAPTSSVMPIADVMAERRMYLPLIGMLLVVVEFLRHWKVSPSRLVAALAAVLCAAGILTSVRAQVWSSSFALWQDTVARSPGKSRPHQQIGFVYYSRGRCDLALEHYQKAVAIGPPDYRAVVGLGTAYDCLGREEEALAQFRQAARLVYTAHIQSLLGMVYIKMGKVHEAAVALDAAERLDPGFSDTYAYRGALYEQSAQWEAAGGEFRRALSLNPSNQTAQLGLARLAARSRGR
jgi:tetratricopeptide (TPR) repeat protein